MSFMPLCVSDERRVKRNDDLSTYSLKFRASGHNTKCYQPNPK